MAGASRLSAQDAQSGARGSGGARQTGITTRFSLLLIIHLTPLTLSALASRGARDSASPPQAAVADPIDANGVAYLVRLDDDLVASHSARCMDGSGGGFYWRPSMSTANASKLVIFLQGGGECRTAAECSSWQGGLGPSSVWWPARHPLGTDVLSGDATLNPEFHDWAKLLVPYCSADMHSGMRRTPSAELGGYYFSGHNIIVATIAQLRRTVPELSPSHVLVGGSSAGGIGALLHADFFTDTWPNAKVRATPACGFFYAGVSSRRDWAAGEITPASSLGFAKEWEPWLSPACTAATGGNLSACTDAHFAYQYVRTPLFVRENLYDAAKLTNCGVDASGAISPTELSYLKQWGKWMLQQLDDLGLRAKHGYFAPSCLAHGENLNLEYAPRVGGIAMVDALRSWFFDLPDKRTRIVDRCGELPCTEGGPERCPHLPTNPLPMTCQERLAWLCPGLHGEKKACDACVRQHKRDAIAHGCPTEGKEVLRWYCGAERRRAGHAVCDVSLQDLPPRVLQW